jgi:hypothetical protein
VAATPVIAGAAKATVLRVRDRRAGTELLKQSDSSSIRVVVDHDDDLCAGSLTVLLLHKEPQGG